MPKATGREVRQGLPSVPVQPARASPPTHAFRPGNPPGAHSRPGGPGVPCRSASSLRSGARLVAGGTSDVAVGGGLPTGKEAPLSVQAQVPAFPEQALPCLPLQWPAFRPSEATLPEQHPSSSGWSHPLAQATLTEPALAPSPPAAAQGRKQCLPPAVCSSSDTQ